MRSSRRSVGVVQVSVPEAGGEVAEANQQDNRQNNKPTLLLATPSVLHDGMLLLLTHSAVCLTPSELPVQLCPQAVVGHPPRLGHLFTVARHFIAGLTRRVPSSLCLRDATDRNRSPGQIAASLASLSRTIDDYSGLSKKELIPDKQEKAFERVKNFRSELAEYRQLYDRLRGEREDAVCFVRLSRLRPS